MGYKDPNYTKNYYKKNKARINKKCKEYYDKVRIKRRYSEEIYNKFGLTIEQYNEIFESQNGVCLICGNIETRTRRGKPTRLAIDHCHISGKVRGLLCSACNSRKWWYETWQQQIENYLKNS